MYIRSNLVCKDFRDNLKDSVEETHGPKLIDHRSTLYLRDKGNQSIIETSKIHNAIIELIE